jgi:Tfp pilus assembly protein PilF
VDFFAKFGEGEPIHVRQAASHYMIGLGYLGKGSRAEAKEHFRKAVELDVNHIWARHHLDEAL